MTVSSRKAAALVPPLGTVPKATPETSSAPPQAAAPVPTRNSLRTSETVDKQASTARAASSLVSRNVTIDGHRTSMRLEPAMWEALTEIGRREKLSLHQLCTIVFGRKHADTSFTAAIRVFAMSYFRAAATEEGHRRAQHGSAFVFTMPRDFAALMPPELRNRATLNAVDDAARSPQRLSGRY